VGRTFSQQAFIFVSSPEAVTPLHMDPEHNFLLQVRGLKTLHLFDPNDFAQANPELWRNRPVTDMFEPGSVNKIITAAAALETGAVSVTRRVQVPTTLQVGNFMSHDSETHPPQPMTLTACRRSGTGLRRAISAAPCASGWASSLTPTPWPTARPATATRCRRPGWRRGRGRRLGLLDLVGVDHIALLEVLVAVDPDTALKAGGHLARVVLHALARRHRLGRETDSAGDRPEQDQIDQERKPQRPKCELRQQAGK